MLQLKLSYRAEKKLLNEQALINIVTATEKAEKTHPTTSETIGIAIEKIR